MALVGSVQIKLRFHLFIEINKEITKLQNWSALYTLLKPLRETGGSHVDVIYAYMPAIREIFFCKIWCSDPFVFIKDEGSLIQKLGVF